MSKKMIKRSLALGALMAFVITGSAMAAELTITYKDDAYTAVGTGISSNVTGNLDEVYNSIKNIGLAGELYSYSKGPDLWNNLKTGFGYFGTGEYSNNTVTINGAGDKGYDDSKRIYGACSYVASQTSAVDANNNTVYVNSYVMGDSSTEKNVTVTGVTGGWGWNNANGNKVYVNDATINSFVYAGDAQFGDANNNQIEIKNSTVGYVNGGVTRYDGADAVGNGKGNTNYNMVKVENVTIISSLKGGAAGGYGNSIGNELQAINVIFTNSSASNNLEAGFTECGNVENNRVVIDGSETNVKVFITGGRSQDTGNAIGNEVIINNGTFTNSSYGICGGLTENEGTFGLGSKGDALGNSVTVNGGAINAKVYGGYSEKGAANENSVTITGGSFTDSTKNIYGGWAATEAIGNVVCVKDVEIKGALRGGVAQTIAGTTATAEANKVYVENAVVDKSVYGGVVEKDNDEDGSAIYNEVKIVNSTVKGEVHGGSVGSADSEASNNKVIIENSKLEKWVSAGHSSYNDAHKNELVISGAETEIASHVYGGRAQGNGSANYNQITINDGVINGPVYGGAANDQPPYDYTFPLVKEATANGNEVIINGGTFKNDVYGGFTTTISSRTGDNYVANENIVIINGGTYEKDIYGGHGVTEAKNNVVNIYGKANVENANIYGGYVMNQDGISTGNTLNLGEGWNGSAKSVQNFNTVNFGKGSSVTTNVTLGSDATINLADGDAYTSEYVIKGELTVDSANATLTIGNIKETTYNIASVYNDTDTTWTLDNDLMQVAKGEDGKEIGWNYNGQLQVTVEAKSATEIADNLGVSQGTASLVEDIISNDNASEEAVQFVTNVMNSGASDEVVKEAYAAMEKMAEAGGQSATAARIVNNVTGVTNDRLSFNCGHSAPHKGGHGVGLLEEGSGADIWVEYVHGKDKVEDMKSSNGASSYEGQYNGFVMGVDFKKVNKFQSGIAFNYGEGDTNSVGSSARTHSDYDFWGVGYYANIHNDDSNVIFDINYAKTDSDVTQNSAGGTLEASPETTTLSAGVKLEKLYQNENVQIVPYTGLRFMSIDTDDYATKGGGFMYNMERQNIWLLPVGVSIRQEVTNDNGWTVSPRVDLSYIWAFGDTNSNMEVKSGNGISPIWYDVMDDGSFLGLVGIEAHKGQWGYGIAYSYQKGDHSESKKWYVDVNYSF